MPPKSSGTKKSSASKEKSPTTTMNDQSPHSDDEDAAEQPKLTFNSLEPATLGIYLWYDSVPPQPSSNHLEMFKKVTNKTWNWPQLCAKPTAAEFETLTKSLKEAGFLAEKKISAYTVIYAVPRHEILKKFVAIRDSSLKDRAVVNDIAKLKTTLAQISVGKEDSEEKRALVEEEIRLKTETDKLEEELEALSYADPERIGELEDAVEESVKMTNNTTEAMFQAHRFYKDRGWFEGSSGEYFKQYQLSEDFDELPRFIRKTPATGRAKGILGGKSVSLTKKKK